MKAVLFFIFIYIVLPSFSYSNEFLSPILNFNSMSCNEIKAQYSCNEVKGYPIHLTFDDGPVVYQDRTQRILNELDKRKIKASFYVLGERIDPKNFEYGNPKKAFEIVNRTLDSGQTLGSHTYHHGSHTLMTEEESNKNIEKGIRLLIELLEDFNSTGISQGSGILEIHIPSRLPYGDGWGNPNLPESISKNIYHNNSPVSNIKSWEEKCAEIMDTIVEHRSFHVGWDIDSRDTDNELTNDERIDWMLKQTCRTKGGIILMHDLNEDTAKNIGNWIDILSCAGHTFHSLEEIMNLRSNDSVIQNIAFCEDPHEIDIDSSLELLIEKLK